MSADDDSDAGVVFTAAAGDAQPQEVTQHHVHLNSTQLLNYLSVFLSR